MTATTLSRMSHMSQSVPVCRVHAHCTVVQSVQGSGAGTTSASPTLRCAMAKASTLRSSPRLCGAFLAARHAAGRRQRQPAAPGGCPLSRSCEAGRGGAQLTRGRSYLSSVAVHVTRGAGQAGCSGAVPRAGGRRGARGLEDQQNDGSPGGVQGRGVGR